MLEGVSAAYCFSKHDNFEAIAFGRTFCKSYYFLALGFDATMLSSKQIFVHSLYVFFVTGFYYSHYDEILLFSSMVLLALFLLFPLNRVPFPDFAIWREARQIKFMKSIRCTHPGRGICRILCYNFQCTSHQYVDCPNSSQEHFATERKDNLFFLFGKPFLPHCQRKKLGDENFCRHIRSLCHVHL